LGLFQEANPSLLRVFLFSPKVNDFKIVAGTRKCSAWPAICLEKVCMVGLCQRWACYLAVSGIPLAVACGGAVAQNGESIDRSFLDGGDESNGHAPLPEGIAPPDGEAIFQDIVEPENDRADGDSGSRRPRVPKVHRATAEMCTGQPPPAADVLFFPFNDAGSSECRINSDCVNGLNGRCSLRVSPIRTDLHCTYDDCLADTDCNSVCQCGRDRAPYKHYCVTANCRTDSDCGNEYCSPTVPFGCGKLYPYNGYYCHTSADECVDDSDCPEAGPGSGSPYCAYDPVVNHWACSRLICVDG
jgi:hypothetical protein